MLDSFHFSRFTLVCFWASTFLLTVPMALYGDVDSQFKEGLATARSGDVEKGLQLLEQACGSGHGEACFWTGEVYSEAPRFVEGVGEVIDLAKSILFFSKSCEKGFAEGCRVMSSVQELCESGDQNNCMYLVTRRLTGSSDSDRQMAVEELKGYCLDSSIEEACTEAARYLTTQGNYEEAKTLLQQACEAGERDVCKLLEQ